jgi:hypothetical protein
VTVQVLRHTPNSQTHPRIRTFIILREGVPRAPFPAPPHMYRGYRGTSLIRNCPPPKDHHRALGIGLL